MASARALHAPEAGVYRDRYIIAIAVTLASVLELLDTSIVNVAIPHMMGTLGATLDQIAWVSTGYIVANIVLPITGWLASLFGRRRYFAGSIALFTPALAAVEVAPSALAFVGPRALPFHSRQPFRSTQRGQHELGNDAVDERKGAPDPVGALCAGVRPCGLRQ